MNKFFQEAALYLKTLSWADEIHPMTLSAFLCKDVEIFENKLGDHQEGN